MSPTQTFAPTERLPVPTQAPAPPVFAGSGPIDEWLAASPWPSHLWPEVTAVALCESTHRPGASNGIAYGLMGLVPLWFDYAGIPFASWADPVANLSVAWAAYQYDISRGSPPWTQWQCRP